MVKLNWRAKRGFAARTTDPSNFSFSWKAIISDGLFLLGFLAFRCRSLCVVRDCHCVWLCKGGHSAAWLCFHALPLRNAVLRGFALCCVTLQLQAVFSHCLCSLFSYRGVNCLPGVLWCKECCPSCLLLCTKATQEAQSAAWTCPVFVWLRPEWGNSERLHWGSCSDPFVSVTNLLFLFDGGLLFDCWFVPWQFSVSSWLGRWKGRIR